MEGRVVVTAGGTAGQVDIAVIGVKIGALLTAENPVLARCGFEPLQADGVIGPEKNKRSQRQYDGHEDQLVKIHEADENELMCSGFNVCAMLIRSVQHLPGSFEFRVLPIVDESAADGLHGKA